MTTMTTTTTTTWTRPEFSDLLAAARKAAKEVRAAARVILNDPKYRVTVDALVAYSGRAEDGLVFDDDKWVSPGRIKPNHKPWAVRFRDNHGHESDHLEGLDDVEDTRRDWIEYPFTN